MKTIFIFMIGVLTFVSCSKSELLDERPKSNLVIPSTLQDFQAVMDYTLTLNTVPVIGEASSDNFYITPTYYNGRSTQSKSLYTWAADIYQGQNNQSDWNLPYQAVLSSNIVLEGLNNHPELAANSQMFNSIKGQALFTRAYAFFNLVIHFSKAYDSATASTDLGIPLRLSSDINVMSTRPSIQQVYDRIVQDLVISKDLLAVTPNLSNKNQPSKPVVYALLSRVYLNVRDYVKAGAYADSCLKIYSTLTDLNTVPQATGTYLPYTQLNNAEVIYNARQTSSGPGGTLLSNIFGLSDQICVDTSLYRSYNGNDLRKTIYFTIRASNGAINLKGGYSGDYEPFGGIATNEMYLNRAECSARAGSVITAMQDLNTLLQKRWKVGVTYIPITAISPADALSKILVERRKELPFSGVRWSDLKRLNKEGANISLTRNINGQIYTLLPNSNRWVFPIPDQVIQISGISQNPR